MVAYDRAVLRQMRAPPGRVLEQVYVEPHIDQVLGYHRKEKSPFLALYPEVNKLRRLGWPMYRMFKEGEMATIGHPFRYLAVVQLMSQDEAYALRHFPFSLASHSHALKWFASLSKRSLTSWADLVEAFIGRFHEYTVEVTPEQVRAVRPLACETTAEFVKRWLNTRLRCPYLRPEPQMVQDCLKTLEGRHDSTPEPPTDHVHGFTQTGSGAGTPRGNGCIL